MLKITVVIEDDETATRFSMTQGISRVELVEAERPADHVHGVAHLVVDKTLEMLHVGK